MRIDMKKLEPAAGSFVAKGMMSCKRPDPAVTFIAKAAMNCKPMNSVE